MGPASIKELLGFADATVAYEQKHGEGESYGRGNGEDSVEKGKSHPDASAFEEHENAERSEDHE
jgi:hypothetical protein